MKYCVECGSKLSMYNKGDRCFRHNTVDQMLCTWFEDEPIQEKKRREQRITQEVNRIITIKESSIR